MWLTERIWEPHLAKPIQEAGIEYTILDDSHFKSAGLPADKMYGYFTTEEQSCLLKIFPISQQLRYFIPFRQPQEVIEFLRSIATESGNNTVVIVDDGEKFGI